MGKIDSRMDGFDSKLDGIRDDIGLVRGGHARNACVKTSTESWTNSASGWSHQYLKKAL